MVCRDYVRHLTRAEQILAISSDLTCETTVEEDDFGAKADVVGEYCRRNKLLTYYIPTDIGNTVYEYLARVFYAESD
jgi:hypothetical protein